MIKMNGTKLWNAKNVIGNALGEMKYKTMQNTPNTINGVVDSVSDGKRAVGSMVNKVNIFKK